MAANTTASNSNWTYTPDSADPGFSIGYDPNAPQYGGGTGAAYNIRGPNGTYDSGLKQWPTSLQAAVQDYANANGGVMPTLPGQASTGSSTGATATGLQPNYSPTPPQSTAAQVNPAAQIQQILAAFQPAANQQSMTLNDSLAAAGITGGGTVGAQQQLAGQQSSSLGSSLASAIENANDLNANSLNSNNQFNTSNLINTENGNVSTANNFEQFLASLQNSDWSQQLGAYTGLQQSGLSGQQGINQASTQNYANPQGTAAGIGSLGSALGNYYGRSTPAATTPASTNILDSGANAGLDPSTGLPLVSDT